MAKLNTYGKQTVLDASSLVLSIVPSSDGTTFATKLIPVNLLGSGGGSSVTEATYEQAIKMTDYGVYISPGNLAYSLASVGIHTDTGIGSDDLNTITKSGTYVSNSATKNGPLSGATGYVFHLVEGGGYYTQVMLTNDGDIYIRTSNGADGTWYPWVMKYTPLPNATSWGTVSDGGTVTFYASSAAYWSANFAGSATINLSTWYGSGKYHLLRVGITQQAAGTITWGTTVNWIKPDGTTSTDFADTGVTWPTAGTIHIDFWTVDGGTTIYGKVIH